MTLTSVGVEAVLSDGQAVVSNAILAVSELSDWTARPTIGGDGSAAVE